MNFIASGSFGIDSLDGGFNLLPQLQQAKETLVHVYVVMKSNVVFEFANISSLVFRLYHNLFVLVMV